MAFDLSTIHSETQIRPPRIVLLGTEKIGKSTFAAGSHKAIVIAIRGEEGIDDLVVSKTPGACQTYGELLGWLQALGTGKHDYGTVVIDSASALEPLVWAEACRLSGNVDSIEKVGGGYGKGYAAAVDLWRKITEHLDYLRSERNLASILVGHTKVKRFDDPTGSSYDTYAWDLHEKAASMLYRWSDAILFCNTKTVVRAEDVGFNKEKKKGIDISGGRRFLFTQKMPAYPAGGRGVYGRLPNEIDLSWNAYMAAIQAVRAAEHALAETK